MKNIFLIAAALGMLLSSPAGAADEKLVKAGTVDVDQTRVSFLVSGNGGGGVLHYRGNDYPFSIGGLGVGGIGISKLKASGDVYNLPELMKFTGLYREFRTGMALGDTGSGKLWLKNADGVVIELKGKGEGVALTIGADAVNISFK
jgi:hypothetical protein